MKWFFPPFSKQKCKSALEKSIHEEIYINDSKFCYSTSNWKVKPACFQQIQNIYEVK